MRKHNKLRNYVLLILFVMIMISGIFAVSYSYYTSAPTSRDIITQSISVDCLTLTTNTVYSTKPAYLYPIDAEEANYKRILQNGASNTGQPVGIATFGVTNSCSEQIYVDILMISQSDNVLDFGNIEYSYCSSNNYTYCLNAFSSTNSGYCAQRKTYNYAHNAGISPEYLNATYSPEFQIYMQQTYGVGQTNGLCAMLGTSGVPINGNSSTKITIRYWLKENASDYDGKTLSARFVMFTKQPGKIKNCTSSTGGSCIWGDVNQDWVVDYQDLLLLFRYVSNQATLNDKQKKCADINMDGVVNNYDTVALYRIALPNYGI